MTLQLCGPFQASLIFQSKLTNADNSIKGETQSQNHEASKINVNKLNF